MHHLPMGTVTFLFTDIEGSTQLLQQGGERYPSLLEEYRSLVRLAIQKNGGHEVDTQGDAFFVAFACATDAICAAVEMQRTLASHAWPEGVLVCVRIGLHTGEPQRASDGYMRLDVHHAARIMSVGHGGQILLSQTTRDLVEHDVPQGVRLRDLGEHRLKDLQRPSRLFQLVMADLPADFPPLRTLDIGPNNLPVQPTPFIGREQEVQECLHLLRRQEVRLLTLTGPGGIGKTRLALQVAAELSDLFPDGLYFVNLAPLRDPALVVHTIAQALDLQETAEHPLLDLVKAFLREKQLLLLLDNFEQVVSAALQVAELLAACPRLKVLVTSRMVLHVQAEQEVAIPPLCVPDPRQLPEVVALAQYDALALFIQRAQAVKPAFQLSHANARAIAEICLHLEGLPLAIELAAARIKLLPPQALLARLTPRLTILSSGARDVPERQQTLRNTIAWSYQLLDAQVQRLFRRLSVFVGGCTLQAIEAMGAALDGEAGGVFEGVACLLDQSLLQQSESEGEEPRLVMLETIREYAWEGLEALGERETTCQAHAEYFLALTEQAEPELDGPQQVVWLERFEREYDNLRAALQWSLEQAGEGEAKQRQELALRLVAGLGLFWKGRGHYREGRDFLERALAGSTAVAAPLQVKALQVAAHLAFQQGDLDRAEALFEECLPRCRDLGDTAGMAHSLARLGAIASNRSNFVVASSRTEEALALFREVGNIFGIAWSLLGLSIPLRHRGEYARAFSLNEEALALFREVGSIYGIVWSLFGLAKVLFCSQGDPATGRALLEEALALCKEMGLKESMSWALADLGEVVLQQGDAVTARSRLQESLGLAREIGKKEYMASSLRLLARVAAFEGDYPAARALYEESLAIGREVSHNLDIPSSLEGLADVVEMQGEPAWAARLWGTAEALRLARGTPLPPVYAADYERAVAAARSQLGEQAFAAAWAQGRTMTPEQALSAQGPRTIPTPSAAEPAPTPPTTSSPTSPDGLTAREVEVLRLVAQGLPDAQVAQELVISPHTVNSHLKAIYGKIGVSSRSAATRYAVEQHLM